MTAAEMRDTRDETYTNRLVNKTTWWKRLLDVQRPYRMHLQGLELGHLLDLGCGIGRNLSHLKGVGVDHNPHSVAIARAQGLTAYTNEEFLASPDARPESYDSILLSHVCEHMTFDDGVSLLKEYLPFLKKGGRVVIITPQEAGYRSDSTHVEFVDLPGARKILEASGLKTARQYSFPFPRPAGKVFRHNEFVTIGQR